jgi:hypothetical protein
VRKKLMMLVLALATLLGAGLGLFSPAPAEAACWTYCCPDTTICFTCCKPGWCAPNCP